MRERVWEIVAVESGEPASAFTSLLDGNKISWQSDLGQISVVGIHGPLAILSIACERNSY
jgi:L-lactate utilization protein LutC